MQRVGRGIRLTEAGRLLADRAAEIIGRIESATAELSTLVGLGSGRVRLAGFSSVMSSHVPRTAALLGGEHPGLELTLTDAPRGSPGSPPRGARRRGPGLPV